MRNHPSPTNARAKGPANTLYFAQSADGTVVDVTQVPRGMACACTCIECGRPLLSKQGEKVSWHFAHVDPAGRRPCGETALHAAAKRVLTELTAIQLPATTLALADRKDSTGWTLKVEATRSAQLAAVHAAELEVALFSLAGDVRLDAKLETELGPLGVEVLVTHAVDAAKRQVLQGMSIPVLEIDLSDQVYKCVSFEDLRGLVRSGAKRELVAGADIVMKDDIRVASERAAQELEAIEAAIAKMAVMSAQERADMDGLAKRAGVDLLKPPVGLGSLKWLGRRDESEVHPTRRFGGTHHKLWQLAVIQWLSQQRIGSKVPLYSVLEGVYATLGRSPEQSPSGDDSGAMVAWMREAVLPHNELRFLYNDDHGWGDDWYRVQASTTVTRGGRRGAATGEESNTDQMGLW